VFSANAVQPMTTAMPEIQQGGLDVSAEEQRYLKRVFRRFALPYLLATIALAGLAAAAGSLAPAAGGDSSAAELETLVAEAASLREAIAAVREELLAQSSAASGRLDSLDQGVAKLRAAASGRLDSLDQGVAKLRAAARGDSGAELASRLDHANQRISALEGRLDKVETSPVARSRQTPTPLGREPGAASMAPSWPPGSPSLP
jgi:hypothetical protein